ncbi:hypothetical protein SAMN05421507_11190 [Lentzea jiangxiensis]|uniref:Uncharacterized protein n=1 Tax=Lentzea jiangxiensis TaxID=641025 RepID=A0A1H0U4A8_9PSEU|nr:hypothetical protein SAMN05421507_11190 [Lentzea jiangxiensis]
MPANDNRSLDRILRTVRGHIRTYNLPRPDRLVISTPSRSVHAEFTAGTAVDRFAAVLLWTATLHGTEFGLTYGARDEIRLAATGQTSTGIGLGLTCSGSVFELGGTVEEHDGLNGWTHRFATLPGLPTLAEARTNFASYDELARLVASARTVTPAVAGVAA